MRPLGHWKRFRQDVVYRIQRWVRYEKGLWEGYNQMQRGMRWNPFYLIGYSHGLVFWHFVSGAQDEMHNRLIDNAVAQRKLLKRRSA